MRLVESIKKHTLRASVAIALSAAVAACPVVPTYAQTFSDFAADVPLDLEMLRGLSFSDAPEAVKKPSSELTPVYLKETSGDRLSGEKLETAGPLYLLSIFNPDVDFLAPLASANKEKSRSFFSFSDNTLYVASDARTPLWNTPLIKRTMKQLQMNEEEFALSIGFSKALAEQNFHASLAPSPADAFDAAMAKSAVADGGTVLLASQYLLRNTGLNILMMPDPEAIIGQFFPMVSFIKPETLKMMPAPAAQLETFATLKGLSFAFQQKKLGADMLLNAAHKYPPLSTEQILHPEKFFQTRDNPIRIEIPDIGPSIGAGAELLFRDTLGELGASVFLSSLLGGESEGRSAAQGWGGDSIAYYRLPDGGRAVAWFATWDDAERAEFFESALRRGAGKLNASNFNISIERIGRDVVFAATPKSTDIAPVVQALWQSMKAPVVVPPPVPEKPDPEIYFTDVYAFMNMFMEKSKNDPPADDTWHVEGDLFRNRKEGYELTRPAPEWHFERVSLGGMFLSELSAINTQVPGSNFSIFTFDRYEPGEPHNPVDEMVSFMRRQMTGFKTTSEKKLTVAGYPARMVTFSGSAFMPLTIAYTEIFAEKHCYIMTFWAVKTSYEKLLPGFEAFRNSFRLIDSK